MLLGARQFFERRGAPTPSVPTARDYVQTGLVAMWDGIENAGWGVHDANATTWKEIISGTYGTTTGALSFGDNYACFDGTSYISFASDAIMDAINANSITIEFVLRPLRKGSQGNSGYIGFAESGTRGFWVWDNYAYAFSSFSWRQNGYVSLDRRWDDFASRICRLGVVASDSSASVSVDDFTAQDGSHGTVTDNTLLLGRAGTSGLAIFDAFVLRLYSRALTASEIAANYAIDKARFNLP